MIYIIMFLSSAPGDPVLSADMDTCSDALAQLDDVIMHTFQQCVYHLTKVRRLGSSSHWALITSAVVDIMIYICLYLLLLTHY